MLIKHGREKEFKTLATKVLVPQAYLVKGCILFSLFANQSNGHEFILYELWKDEEAVDNYYKKLILALGKNSQGNVFPDKLNDFIEEDEDILHQEIKDVE